MGSPVVPFRGFAGTTATLVTRASGHGHRPTRLTGHHRRRDRAHRGPPRSPAQDGRTAQLRANTALVCRALPLGGTVIWTDPQRRRDTAELLGGLDDTALRAASAVLLREPTGPVDREAMVASLLRCDLYLRYHR
ncbi:hypothetical protein ACWGA9_43170 [Streptomyces sp. NPDC054950]|uniref:hypothetical protein n=1 Tax=Streptomyces sp. NBC_00723 TaxID=2903673 RepID=UPI0038630CF9